jgi:hypothetical protein
MFIKYCSAHSRREVKATNPSGRKFYIRWIWLSLTTYLRYIRARYSTLPGKHDLTSSAFNRAALWTSFGSKPLRESVCKTNQEITDSSSMIIEEIFPCWIFAMQSVINRSSCAHTIAKTCWETSPPSISSVLKDYSSYSE